MEECYFLSAEACNFTKSKTPPWVFFTFLKLYKWYQIAQSVSFESWYSWLSLPVIKLINLYYNKVIT